MSNIVYPNIGAVNEDTEAKKENLIQQPQPQITINNSVHIQKEEDEVKKEEPSTSEIDLWGKRVKITGWILIAIGAISALNCAWVGLNARHMTEKILSGEFKKGGFWKKKHHHFEKHETFKLPDTIDRDEFALYDTIKTLSLAGVFLSMLILCTGKKALCAVWKQKPEFNKKVFKKSIFRVILMVLTCMYIHHHAHEAKAAYYRFRKRHNLPVAPHLEAEMMELEKEHEAPRHHGRHHKKEHGKHRGRSLFQLEEGTCRTDHSDENSCNADPACSWCKSAAVASSCNELADAKALPPAVFSCSKVSEDEQFDFVKNEIEKAFNEAEEMFDFKPKHKKHHKRVSEEDRRSFWKTVHGAQNGCDGITDENSCDAVAECTWCKSAAVRSSCKLISDAKALPPSIFACDKIQEEKEPVMEEEPEE